MFRDKMAKGRGSIRLRRLRWVTRWLRAMGLGYESLGLAIAVSGASETAISLSQVTVGAGQTATLTVVVTGMEGLTAGDLAVHYDPRFLIPVRAEKPAASGDLLLASSPTPGGWAISLAASPAGTFLSRALVQLVFAVAGDAPVGSIPVRWSKAELFGPNLAPREPEMVAGMIHVSVPGDPACMFAQISRQEPAQAWLAFPTSPGWRYEVLYSGAISNATWRVLGSAVTGNGSIMSVTDSMHPFTRFYRLRIQPP